MSLSRRKFLAATPLAVGAILPLKGLALNTGFSTEKSTARDAGDRLASLTWDSFYPYVTTNFAFSSEGGARTDLVLAKMTDTRPRGFVARTQGEECFSLTFRGPLRKPLVQDVYAVEHFALASFSLLVTVVGETKRGMLYEAVINRITG
jgi:hypothetical protein